MWHDIVRANSSHNAHHVVTNSESHDPDIQHIPFFAVSADMFKKGGVWSYYHRRFFHFDAGAHTDVHTRARAHTHTRAHVDMWTCGRIITGVSKP